MLEPLQDEFMRRAILELTLLGLAGGALGCWVVLYELSYAAESLAHSIFPGLVLAAIAGVPLLLGGAPAIAVAALAIALLTRLPGVSRDVGPASDSAAHGRPVSSRIAAATHRSPCACSWSSIA